MRLVGYIEDAAGELRGVWETEAGLRGTSRDLDRELILDRIRSCGRSEPASAAPTNGESESAA